MHAAITRKSRRDLDFYRTEEAITNVLVEKIRPYGSVLEPCAGDGAISNFLATCQNLSIITATDIVYPIPEGCDRTTNDATDERYWQSWRPFDWVITNPPFNQAHLILPLAYQHAKVGIAMLLRLTYLEPAGNRAEWLNSNKLSRVIIFGQPRPSFSNNGKTDSVTVAWMIWRKDWAYNRNTKIDWVFDWKNK